MTRSGLVSAMACFSLVSAMTCFRLVSAKHSLVQSLHCITTPSHTTQIRGLSWHPPTYIYIYKTKKTSFRHFVRASHVSRASHVYNLAPLLHTLALAPRFLFFLFPCNIFNILSALFSHARCRSSCGSSSSSGISVCTFVLVKQVN
jgi:hypothetical protein